MIGFFRKLSQSWPARIPFAILAIAFKAYGVNRPLAHPSRRETPGLIRAGLAGQLFRPRYERP